MWGTITGVLNKCMGKFRTQVIKSPCAIRHRETVYLFGLTVYLFGLKYLIFKCFLSYTVIWILTMKYIVRIITK